MSEQDARADLADELERDAGWIGGPIAGRMRQAATALRSASPEARVEIDREELLNREDRDRLREAVKWANEVLTIPYAGDPAPVALAHLRDVQDLIVRSASPEAQGRVESHATQPNEHGVAYATGAVEPAPSNEGED